MNLRRLFSEMEDPAECMACGKPAVRRFSVNGSIQIPIHFRSFLTGGAPAGGQLGWYDFHDKSEKELAHEPGVERLTTAASRPGANTKGPTLKEREADKLRLVEAYKQAKATTPIGA